MTIPTRYFKVSCTFIRISANTNVRFPQILQALTASAASGQRTVKWGEFHGVRAH